MTEDTNRIDYWPGVGEPTPLPAILEDTHKRAEAGDGAAARQLGDCYREGDTLPYRPRRAFRWYVRGAFAGDLKSINNLRVCYHNGFGCPVNFKQAVHWYQRGANFGSPHAQENLGHCYLKGMGIAKNRELAIQWLQKAAAQGLEKARARLEEIGVTVENPAEEEST